MNLMLGSGRTNTLVQLRYLGTCLKGNALEWYSREVEHYTRSTRGWTLESALIGLQDQFLDPLTWRHVSMQFDTAQQGSGTVQDLLNQLTKFVAQMVQYPDGYTMQKRFLAALREPLCRAVLMRGLTPEYSNLAELASAARQIEEAMCYELSTWHMEEAASSCAASPEPHNDGP